MNAITRQESAALPALQMSEQELMKVLQSSLYPGANPESIKMVLGYCRASGLDPMQKPVHIVPMWDSKSGCNRDVVMPGIGLYRTQAARTGCAGVSEPDFGPDVTEALGGQQITYPAWCRVTVKRKIGPGEIVEFTAKEFWKENYAVKGGKERSIAPNAMWTKRPYGQIAKCAEAQALRKAFPEIGSEPTADEMAGKAINEFDGTTIDGTTGEVMQKAAPAELVSAGKAEAGKGKKAFAAWIKIRTEAERAMLSPHKPEFEAIWTKADAERTVQAQAPAAPAAAQAQDVVTLDMVIEKMRAATNLDALDVAADWMNALADPAEIAQAEALCVVRQTALGA